MSHLMRKERSIANMQSTWHHSPRPVNSFVMILHREKNIHDARPCFSKEENLRVRKVPWKSSSAAQNIEGMSAAYV